MQWWWRCASPVSQPEGRKEGRKQTSLVPCKPPGTACPSPGTASHCEGFFQVTGRVLIPGKRALPCFPSLLAVGVLEELLPAMFVPLLLPSSHVLGGCCRQFSSPGHPGLQGCCLSLFHFWVLVPPSDVAGPTRAGISRPSNLSVCCGS